MPDTLFDPQADDQKLLAQTIDHYHQTLNRTSDGRNYLLRRGISSLEAIDHFRIGFVDHSLVSVLPHYQCSAGKAIRARLQGLGILRASSHQHFKGCVVFPVTAADGSGRIVDIYGRRVSQGIKLGSPRHRHLSEDRPGVWNVKCFADTDEVILCPSLFDGLSFWSAGSRNVTCTFGPDALTEDHLVALREFGIRRVFLMAETIVPRLLAAGIECYLLRFPPGVDANQYARKTHEPSHSLETIIAKAERLGTVAVQEMASACEEAKQAAVTPIQPEAESPPLDACAFWADDDQKLLAQVVEFYHRTLKETTEGLDYLHKCGITAGEAIDRFHIGYANRTLGLKLPERPVRACREVRARLQRIGIYRDTGREHMNGCVVFPITTTDGRIVDLYGRRIADHLPKEMPQDIFLLQERRGVWNIEALRESDEIILCPSLFDALAFWCAGYRNVTCTFGPDALTEDHLVAFAEFGVRRVLNDGKILLANLSTGLLTEKVAGTLGSFLVTKIVNAAFRRAGLPEAKRRPWYLYVDEFQSFMNLSVGFERILAEARKYRLVLAGLANQYVGQLSQAVRQAVFGNVGSLIVFRLGVDDAHAAAKELGIFTAEDILNLEVGQAIARVGISASAFNLQTFREPPAPTQDPTRSLVALARQRYARSKHEVEAELNKVAKAAEKLEMIADSAEEPSDPNEDDLVT